MGRWLERLRDDDAEALEELLDRHWDPLVAYARGFFEVRGGGDDAEDAAQRAFVRLWEGRHRWAGGSALGLLYRIVRNLCLNERRRAANHERLVPSAPDRANPPTPLQELEASELQQTVTEAIASLSPRCREVFELSRFHGLTYRQIAQALEISPQTVANQLSTALDHLHQAIAHHLPSPDERTNPPDGAPSAPHPSER